MQIAQDYPLPTIRQDLKIYQGDPDFDGAPTWMLYDPLSDNYFKIGWFEFEVMQRISKYKTAMELCQSIQDETTLVPDIDDISEFINFLMMNRLLITNTQELRDKVFEEEKSPSVLKRIFGSYLFITVPLFRPEKFLQGVFPVVSFLFTRSFLIFVLFLLSCGIILTLQRLDEFFNTFTHFFSLEGVVLVAISTIIVKAAHELGHAFMATKYKVPVSTIGVSFIVFFPILYTETTNAWRLYDRRKRINIAAAGLMSEITLAAFALLIWHALSPGMWQNFFYFIAFISLAFSLLINLNPLMKFDGYYLFSDIVRVDNLQNRSIFFLKWKLREILFNLKREPPETLGHKYQRFLTLFGFSLCIYRFFLYLGIAIIVYTLVFKPLGLILMLGQLFWFIGLPILKEIGYWFENREKIFGRRPRVFATVIIFVFLTCCLFLPVQRSIAVPSVMHTENFTSLYPHMPSVLKRIGVMNGQKVKEGDVLFVLESQELEKEIKRSQAQLKMYQKVKERNTALLEKDQRQVLIDEKIAEARVILEGLSEQKQKMTVRAKFDGVIRDISKDIYEGRVVNQNMVLARLVNLESIIITGYVHSRDIDRISLKASGFFIEKSNPLSRIDVILADIAKGDTRSLDYPELSALHGGPIASDPDNTDTSKILSREPLYRLSFRLDEFEKTSPYTIPGTIILHAEAHSVLGNIFNRLTAFIINEMQL